MMDDDVILIQHRQLADVIVTREYDVEWVK